MHKIKDFNLIDYISLILVMSFFLIHNIYIVIIGLLLSIYSINKNIINNTVRLINDKQKEKGEKIQNVKINKRENKTEIETEDCKISLVETIEELGFIPSQERDNDNRAA